MASFYLEADHFDFGRPSSAGVPKGTKYDYVYNGKKGGQDIVGTGGNDKITDQYGGDKIWTFGGDDWIKAGYDKNQTCIYAGAGNDTIYFGKNDLISGGTGADKFIPQSKDIFVGHLKYAGLFLITDFSHKEGDSLKLNEIVNKKSKYLIEVNDEKGTKNDYAWVSEITNNGERVNLFDFSGKAVQQFKKDVKMSENDNASHITAKALIDYFMNTSKNTKLTKGEFDNFNIYDAPSEDFDTASAPLSQVLSSDFLL